MRNADLYIVGQRLKAAREKAGLTLDQASRQAGFSSKTRLEMAEKGEGLSFSEKRLKRIAQRYGVSVDYLLGASDDPNAQEAFDSSDNLKAIAQRLREAREDADLTQEAAAKLMGYANSSRLAKVENGLDMKSIPLNIVIKAADLYGVSVDFLCCRSNYPDHDPHATAEWSALSHLRGDVMKVEEVYLARLKRAWVEYTNLAAAVEAALPVVSSTKDRIEQFRRLNKDVFDELRGGASVLRAAEELKGLFGNIRSLCWRAGRDLDGVESEPEDGTERVDAAILRLAALSKVEYERTRKQSASTLGVRTSLLDALVKDCQRKGGGRQVELPFGVDVVQG